MRTNKEHFTTVSVARETKAKIERLGDLLGKGDPKARGEKLPAWLVIDLALRTLEHNLKG